MVRDGWETFLKRVSHHRISSSNEFYVSCLISQAYFLLSIFHKSRFVFILIFWSKQSCQLDFFPRLTGIANLTKELDEFELKKTEARAVTGVLASHPNSTDVHISSLSLTFHGQELLADTSLELNSGRRYGLIGLNGTGNKLLYCLRIPNQWFIHFPIYSICWCCLW